MGAPKQKWTAEEEAALRAGVEKYGPGKWRAIQKDAKFGPCLTSRSNVDLKDKWRNMSVSANGIGSSRERKSLALSGGPTLMDDAADVSPLASASPDGNSKPLLLTGAGHKGSDRKSLGARYDDLVVEAILGLKDSNGSSNASIASYIEERHPVPPNFRRLLTSKLKALALQGKLVKVKQNYKVNSGDGSDSHSEGKPVKSTRPRRPEVVPEEIRRTPRFPRDPAKKLRGDPNAKKPKTVDTEVARTKMKTAEEAARAAVQAVAEAEAAAAAAEQAAREAEIAEQEAEAAEAAAQAAALAVRPHKKSVRAIAMARAEEVSVKG